MTVADAIQSCFEARQAALKGDGKAGRWMSPLSTHVIPEIGAIAIEDVDQHVLKRVLEPIWHDKPDSARKAMNRMNLTLKHAAALGLGVDLQSSMKARALLGKQRHEAQHIPSMPYKEAPAFYRLLSDKPHMSYLALRFLMLSVLRMSELRFARHADIDAGQLIENRMPSVDEGGRGRGIAALDQLSVREQVASEFVDLVARLDQRFFECLNGRRMINLRAMNFQPGIVGAIVPDQIVGFGKQHEIACSIPHMAVGIRLARKFWVIAARQSLVPHQGSKPGGRRRL